MGKKVHAATISNHDNENLTKIGQTPKILYLDLKRL